MEGMASILSYQQSIEELQHSLLCTSMELESVQLAVEEEKRRSEEYIKQLIQLLQVAFQERDEAKNHLQRLLNKYLQSGTSQFCHVLPNVLPGSPPVIPSEGNQHIIESDIRMENYHRHSSSADSFFDAVPSQDISIINVVDSAIMNVIDRPFVKKCNASLSVEPSHKMEQSDPATKLINQLAVKRTLPEKGKLLHAVMEAGPLLQTLLLAGPLPQWRNPPPPQPLEIPPISIQAHDPATLVPISIASPKCRVQSPLITSDHRNSKDTMLNFSSTAGSCMKKRFPSHSDVGSHLFNNPSLISNLKRQKFE